MTSTEPEPGDDDEVARLDRELAVANDMGPADRRHDEKPGVDPGPDDERPTPDPPTLPR